MSTRSRTYSTFMFDQPCSPSSRTSRLFQASLLISAALIVLAGCRSEESSGIRPVSRIPDLESPTTRTVQVAASEANAAAAARTEVMMAADRPAGGADSGTFPTVSSTTNSTDAARIQGIPAPPPTTIHQGGNVLAVAGIAFTVPIDWKQQAPSSGLRAAQYAIPGPGGDAEAVIFFFGPGQGGNVDQNVQRWVSQFSSQDPANRQLAGEVGTMEAENLRITLVRTEGTYDPGMMVPGGDNTPKPNYALFGLVVEGGPEGNLFVKVTGPADTMRAQRSALEEFARSTRPSRFK